MPKAKPLTKEQIVAATNKTLSNRAAARYLNVSYQHFKKWAKLYQNDKGETLFDAHKNQSGKGIPKFLKGQGKEPALLDIIEGRIDASSFSPEKIKYRLITEGHLLEECSNCGYNEIVMTKDNVALLIDFKDGDSSHTTLDNIRLLCPNCYLSFNGHFPSSGVFYK